MDGTPTGGLIEAGINSTGAYRKFACGLAIGLSRVLVDLTISGYQNYVAPISFSGDWATNVSFFMGGMSGDQLDAAAAVVCGPVSEGGSNYRISVRNSAPAETPPRVGMVTSIGYWK